VRRAVVLVAVALGLGAAGAGAYTTTLVTVRGLVVLDCDRATRTFCSVGTASGRVPILYTGTARFASVPRVGSRVDVRGYDVRDASDAYLGVIALAVPGGTARTTVRRTGTATTLVLHGKVGAVTLLTPSFENTTTGDCVVMVFRRASVPAFTGTPSVVMNKNFEIP